jgi:predicted phosphodiesterase
MRIILGLLISAALASQANAHAQAAWVELTGEGAQVRAVTNHPACPVLKVDGKVRAMRERTGAEEGFANRVCQADLPKRAKVATLDDHPLALPKARPNRIVIFGDTGCRIVPGMVQNCSDALAGWPFARIAGLAAAKKPDLVIHVGDYYYREAPCPANTDACTGSPFGDKWPTWKAELFDPGKPLLAAAPWVFARGNHEDCRRGGAGWFRLLDADRAVRTCRPDALTASDPFTVDIGGVKLAVLDSADADDNKAQPQLATAFGLDLARVLPADEPVWLVTHRPLWALSHSGLTTGGDWGNVNLRAGAKAHGLDGVDLIVAGHIHNFTSLDFGKARPPSLIVGSGGTAMDPRDRPKPLVLDLPVDGLPAKALTFGDFGYFVLDRKGAGWTGVFRDTEDRVLASCTITGASLKCVPVAPKT